jgi:hypothetical protein
MQGLPGSWNVHPIPLPRSTIPAGPHRPHPTGRHDAVPAIPTTKTPAILISELNTVASASAVYASSGALPHPHARLASGWWLAIAGRESNPLDFSERFLSSTSDFPFPRLILARRNVGPANRVGNFSSPNASLAHFVWEPHCTGILRTPRDQGRDYAGFVAAIESVGDSMEDGVGTAAGDQRDDQAPPAGHII